MTELISIRASAADRIMICNYSSIKPTIKLDTSGPWTHFGNAGHEVMAEVVKDDLNRLPDISRALSKHKVTEEKSLRIACYVGLKAYTEQIQPELDRNTLFSEEEDSRKFRDKYLLTGHPDIAGVLYDGETLFVGDWKFGDFGEHWNQLKQYAYILLQRFPAVKTVLLGAFFLRVNEQSIQEFSRDHIENEWADDYFEALEGDSLKPCFDACKYCPVLNCEAGNKWSRSTVSSLATITDEQSTAVALAERFEDVKFIERRIEQYKAHLKDYLLLNNESIKTKEGKVLSVIEGHRGTLYLWQAREILSEYFEVSSNTELMDKLKSVITVKKTELMELIGQKAERGMEGKEKKRMNEEMEQVGALKVKTFDKLCLKKGEGDE